MPIINRVSANLKQRLIAPLPVQFAGIGVTPVYGRSITSLRATCPMRRRLCPVSRAGWTRFKHGRGSLLVSGSCRSGYERPFGRESGDFAGLTLSGQKSPKCSFASSSSVSPSTSRSASQLMRPSAKTSGTMAWSSLRGHQSGKRRGGAGRRAWTCYLRQISSLAELGNQLLDLTFEIRCARLQSEVASQSR